LSDAPLSFSAEDKGLFLTHILMAENKKSFVLYCDLIHTISKMPSDKAGDLFKHILEYVNDKNPTTDDLIINLTFEPIKQQLKRDLDKYESIRERNSLAARKRWDASASSGIPNDAKNADNDNDNDNDINSIDFIALLSFFNKITGKKIRVIGTKAKRQFNARLKEGYTKEDVGRAIVNCFNDPYHKENTHFLTPEFISRSDKFEKYLNVSNAKKQIDKPKFQVGSV
jgi:uncharacterized phage protein (TIGR02220 family)